MGDRMGTWGWCESRAKRIYGSKLKRKSQSTTIRANVLVCVLVHKARNE